MTGNYDSSLNKDNTIELKNEISSDCINHFAAAMKRALSNLDNKGRLKVDDARAVRNTIAKTPAKLRLEIASELKRYFGPFETLPLNGRDAIVRAVYRMDILQMAVPMFGGFYIRLPRLLNTLRGKLRKYQLHRLAKLLAIFELIVKNGPFYMRSTIHQGLLGWQGKFSVRPKLPAILKLAGIKPRDLALCYAKGIPQPLAYRGFWHNSELKSTYGIVLAMDFIPTPEGYWHIENNLDFGVSEPLTAPGNLYNIVTNQFKFIEEKGYNKLVIINKSFSSINRKFVRLYEEAALAQGIKLTVIEDVYLPKSNYLQSFHIPSLDDKNTLVLRMKAFNTGLDYLLTNKGATQRVLEVYKKHTHNPFLLLPASSKDPLIGDVNKDDSFPNLVYKFPDNDSGLGVIFLKAKSSDHAKSILKEAIKINTPRDLNEKFICFIKNRGGRYQSYVHSPFASGRRLSKVRAYVMLTPVGNRFLSAQRVISKFDVPEHLPFGVIKDQSPYLINFSNSLKYEDVSIKEMPAVSKAALAVANGISWSVNYGFQTKPENR